MRLHYSFVAFLLASALALGRADEVNKADTSAKDRVAFKPSTVPGHFVEQFTPDWVERWSTSKATKEEGGEELKYVGVWSVEEPTVYPGIENDAGLVAKTAAALHAISAQFTEPLDNTGKTLVVQYEVKPQQGLDCAGAYLKLLTKTDSTFHAEEFNSTTPYTIMFGPDRCGATNKVHFIFRHKHPKTGEYEEKHLIGAPTANTEKTSSLYTLIVRPDNSFEIRVNDKVEKSGNLLESFSPPVNPPKDIDDPDDKKPDDWVDNPKIADPDAKKPDDWDESAPFEIVDEDAEKPDDWLEEESLTIPDPEADKPEYWDDEEDGAWVPPQINNPKCENVSGCGPWQRPMKRNPNYKGKWYPPQIDNPDYKGPWSPRKIPNPDYVEDATPSNFEKMEGIGFEIWTMQKDILFDNIYIGHSEEDAKKFAEETWAVKHKIEKVTEEKEEESVSPSTAPSFSDDPAAYLQHKVNEFLAVFWDDPIKGITEFPVVAGGLAGGFLVFFVLLGLLFSLLTPAKKAYPHKKTDEPTPDDKDPAADGPNLAPTDTKSLVIGDLY
ncbi:5126_t:CDS:10 [Paraglomus occultum]|uniref:5126_t:CDS:1 n=1 Tax=Paraglomus occultum TaxID=144539 RepID=A0A9N9F8J8_9GLOM|nr:5126_t:CDS:10 [Paraglomus occultum]